MVGSLGAVTVTTAGTPERITKLAPTSVQDAKRLGAKSARIQAMPDNTGLVYVGLAGMEGSPQGPNLLGVIPKPVSATTGPFETFEIHVEDVPAGLNLYDIFLDVTVSGEGAIVSYTAN
jgi:hypothetical protein